MASKKERNHYDLKEIENYFPKDWLDKIPHYTFWQTDRG